jgi:hypothetical protein
MSKKYILGLLIVSSFTFNQVVLAENHDKKKPDHHEKEKHHDEKEGHSEDGHDDHAEHSDHDDHAEHSDHDEHGHGGGKAIGKGKAITDVSEENGFKLSVEAISRLKLKLQTIDTDEFIIKKSTLVTSKGIKGLYRFRDGYFKFLNVKLNKQINKKYLVKVKGIEFGDQVVIRGVGLLRVADIFSTDKSEYGHAH